MKEVFSTKYWKEIYFIVMSNNKMFYSFISFLIFLQIYFFVCYTNVLNYLIYAGCIFSVMYFGYYCGEHNGKG